MAEPALIKFSQDERGRWIIHADGKPVHTVGRRIGRFRTREDAERYVTRRFGKPEKP